MIKLIGKFFDGLRKKWLRRGYACDSCGGELFDYPVHRLCAACEGRIRTPERTCPKCGRAGKSDGVCMTCKDVPPRFKKGVVPFVYQGETAALVNRMKNGYPRLACYFGERMADSFMEQVELREGPLLVVAVPACKERTRLRGFNQSERLAESVCERLQERGVDVELRFDVLEKGRETRMQKRMTRKQRMENVKGAYRVRDKEGCRGKTTLLIDDILTTGTTSSECAKQLLRAKAKEVYFLAVAATPEERNLLKYNPYIIRKERLSQFLLD